MKENWENHWKDYYQILQVHPSAEQEIITAAYRKLADKYHPDHNRGKEQWANEKFKEINEAYEILGNINKREYYDKYYSSKTHASYLTKSEPKTNTPNKTQQKSKEQSCFPTLRELCIPSYQDTISERQKKLIKALEYVLKVTTKFGFMEKGSLKTELQALYTHVATTRSIEITIDIIQKHAAWSRIFVKTEKGYYNLKDR